MGHSRHPAGCRVRAVTTRITPTPHPTLATYSWAVPISTVPACAPYPRCATTLRRTPRWSAQFEADPIEKLLDLDSNPVGGFDWDGRFDTLHEQAQAPLLADNQMANATHAALVLRLSTAVYAREFERLFGSDVWSDPERAFSAALQALERFELDDPSFYPFTSRYDEFLNGTAALSAKELRGLALFNAPDKGNCASCHTSSLGADGSHPLFTDFGFESLGVPRNPRIPANRDPAYYDLGLCGPQRTDLQSHTAYCGLFKTPSLRNVATRRVFFHNGSFRSLREVLRFYVARDLQAQRWYPMNGSRVALYDDLPPKLRAKRRSLQRAIRRRHSSQARVEREGNRGCARIPRNPHRSRRAERAVVTPLLSESRLEQHQHAAPRLLGLIVVIRMSVRRTPTVHGGIDLDFSR